MNFLGYSIKTSIDNKRCCGYHKITKSQTPIFSKIDDLKDWVRDQKSPRSSWKNARAAHLTFNKDVSNDIIGDYSDFACTFDLVDEQPTIKLGKTGDFRVYSRSNNEYDVPGGRIGTFDIDFMKILGLIPHARYVLEETKIPNIFNIIFDSVISVEGECIQLNTPAFSTGAHRS